MRAGRPRSDPSLFLPIPTGNQVELYVDTSDVWKTEPQRVAQAAKLAL